MIGDAGEDGAEVLLGVAAVECGGADQGTDGGSAFTTWVAAFYWRLIQWLDEAGEEELSADDRRSVL